MAVVFLGRENFPTYIAKAVDYNSSGSLITGTPQIGKTVYLTDSKEWYIVIESSGSSYKLESFVMPALET